MIHDKTPSLPISWPAIKYLERCISEADKNQAKRILEIIRRASEELDSSAPGSIGMLGSFATIIGKLQLDLLTNQDIEMCCKWMKNTVDSTWVGKQLGEMLIPRLLESTNNSDWGKALVIFEAMAKPKKAFEENDENHASISNYQLKLIVDLCAKKLGERCGLAATKVISTQLAAYIGDVENDRHSYIWRPCIEDQQQEVVDEDTRFILVDALRNASLGVVESNRENINLLAEELLKSPYVTIARIGIYVCGEHYPLLRTSFWHNAQEKWFEEIPYWHEIYWFIRKTYSQYIPTEKEFFWNFARAAAAVEKEHPKSEEWNEQHLRDILHAAAGQGDATLDEEYRKLVEKLGEVREHPDFHIYSGPATWVDLEKSPYSSEKILQMSNEELVKFCTDFVPDNHSLNGPTYQGVASALSAAVRASDDGFKSRLTLFIGFDRPYQYGLLKGLEERWREDKRDIPWAEILQMAGEMIATPAFKNEIVAESSKEWGPNIQWLVTSLADLIKSSADKERPPKRNIRIESINILGKVLELLPLNQFEQNKDAVNKAINTTRGRMLEAFIHISLALRREDDTAGLDEAETWKVIGDLFEKEAVSANLGQNSEFSVLAGIYCLNIHYINAGWADTNFDKLFSLDNLNAWKCAAQGFSHQNYVSDWMYSKLIKGGHLRRFIWEGLPENVERKALQFLGIGYLRGMEVVETEKLFREVIESLDNSRLQHLCWFFWTMRVKEGVSPNAQKILAFLYEVAERMGDPANNPQLAASLIQLLAFETELSPAAVDIYIRLAPYAEKNWHGYILLENLARLVTSHPEQVSKILKSALTGFLPSYREEIIVEIVRQLDLSGFEEDAQSICNFYVENGSYILKPLYEEIVRKGRSLSN